MSTITLTEQEIEEITHYKKPSHQIRSLRELGIKAEKRPDNTVLVFRHHLTQTQAANDAKQPSLKSSRR
jgi:hypothetical protein